MKTIKIFPDIPDNIDVKCISQNRALISAYPFETGYAITLAHPLRRLMMSSSVGYAIIGININGISHEFDSVKGMVEDVSLFLLNLRKIRFNVKNTDDVNITLDYSFSGDKIIMGADFNNDVVDVVNPDIYICTINDDVNMELSIMISKGIGYVPSEDIRHLIPDTFIPVDAYFTPVKKVIYDIENVLVRDDPTFEKIVFDIETDGRITAVDAFKHSVLIMNKQMSIFNRELNILDSSSGANHDTGEIKILLQPLDALNLSARCYNCLNKMNLKYVGELVLMKDIELKNIKSLGKKSYDEIVDKIKSIGYEIGAKLPDNVVNVLVSKFSK